MGLSRRAYAQHRGVSDMAVRKALAAGRITLEADGTIDPDKADAAWNANKDHARDRGSLPSPGSPVTAPPPSRAEAPSSSRRTRPVPPAAVEAVRETLRESGEPAPAAGAMSFVQARTANEVIKAQERRLRLGRLRGELVDKARATPQRRDQAAHRRRRHIRFAAFRVPNEAAITRLVGAILIEQNDEWAVQRARYMALETMTGLSMIPSSASRPCRPDKPGKRRRAMVTNHHLYHAVGHDPCAYASNTIATWTKPVQGHV